MSTTDPAAAPPSKDKPSLTALCALVPVLLAVAAPFFYLNGKAYHDGYLSHFQLEPSMFPMDTSATLVTALLAWMHAAQLGVDAFLAFFEKYVFYAMAALAIAALLFGVLTHGLKKYLDKLRPQRRPGENEAAGLFAAAGRFALFVCISVYLPFALMVLTVLAIVIVVVPFVHIGQQQAQKDMAQGFARSPVVSMADPAGHVRDYRLMMCATHFCALYADNKAITVPASAIIWTVSDLSKPGPTAGRARAAASARPN